jgi:ABC-2 type transport system ATP-binding protein
VSDTAAIETTGLTKRYGDVVALDSLNLTVQRGEVFGFLGPNGAGKTTTVKLILGLVKPTSGEVRIFGRPVERERKQLLRQIGAMVEAPAFYPYLTGRENLVVLAKMARLPEHTVDDALGRAGLASAVGRPFETYSMGMKQRLAIAAALLRRPKLVLLDEPTSGLDPAGQREIRALIPQLAHDGCTIFLSSHMMHEVQEICDRVGILFDGRLQRTAPVAELLGARDTIEIRVEDHATARAVLQGIDWVAGVDERDGLLLVNAPHSRAADVNRALAGAGIFASEIRWKQRDLEDAFFETLAEQAA